MKNITVFIAGLVVGIILMAGVGFYHRSADLNYDGKVDAIDLSILISHYSGNAGAEQ